MNKGSVAVYDPSIKRISYEHLSDYRRVYRGKIREGDIVCDRGTNNKLQFACLYVDLPIAKIKKLWFPELKVWRKK